MTILNIFGMLSPNQKNGGVQAQSGPAPVASQQSLFLPMLLQFFTKTPTMPIQPAVSAQPVTQTAQPAAGSGQSAKPAANRISAGSDTSVAGLELLANGMLPLGTVMNTIQYQKIDGVPPHDGSPASNEIENAFNPKSILGDQSPKKEISITAEITPDTKTGMPSSYALNEYPGSPSPETPSSGKTEQPETNTLFSNSVQFSSQEEVKPASVEGGIPLNGFEITQNAPLHGEMLNDSNPSSKMLTPRTTDSVLSAETVSIPLDPDASASRTSGLPNRPLEFHVPRAQAANSIVQQTQGEALTDEAAEIIPPRWTPGESTQPTRSTGSPDLSIRTIITSESSERSPRNSTLTSTISSGQIIQGAAVDLLAGLSPQEGKNIQTITLPSPSLAKKVPNADVMPHGTMTSKSVADEGLSDITPTVATSPSATIGTNQGTKNRDDGTIVLTSTGQGNIGKQPAQNGGIENVKNAISLSQEQNNIPTSIPDGTDNIFDSLSKGIRGDAQPNPVTSNERVESAPFIAPAAPLTQNMQVEDVSEPKGITSREPIAQQVDSSSNLGSPSSTDAGEDNGAQQEISDQQISVPILRSPAPFIDAEAQRELPAQFGITGQTNLHSQYGREPVRVSDVERDGNVFTPRIATEIPPQEIDQPITPNENIPLRPAGFNVDDKSVGSKGAYNTAPAATSAQPQLSPQQTENVTLIPNVKAEPIKPAMNTLPVENPHQPAELPNDLIFDPETSSNAGKFESAADLPPMPLSSASRSIDQELGEKLPQALTPELSAKTHQREEFHPSSSVATAAENAETAVSPKEMAEQGGVAVQEMQTEVQSPELPVDIGLVNEEGQGEDPAVEMPTLKTSTATFTSVPPEIKAAKGENSPSIPTAGYLDQGRSGGTQSTSTALPVAQNEIDPINIRPDSAQNDTGTVPNAGAVGKMGGKNLSQAPAPKKTEASPVLSEISSPFKNQKEIEPENTIRHDGAPTPVNHPDVNGKIDKGEEPEAHVSAMNELAPSTEPAKNGTQGGNDRNSTSNGQLHSQGKISGAPAQPAEFDQAVPTPENVSSKTEPVISMASNNQNKNAGIPASQTELLSKLANQVSGLHSPSIAAFRSEPAVKGGSSASSPQAGLLPGNLEQSIMDQVSKSLAANFKNNSSEIRITMKPESLGEVTMKVKMDDGKVSAQIDVSNANVKAVLDTNVAQLRDTLLSKGIDVHRIDVVADGQTAFGGSSEESKSKRQANEKNASGANAVEQYESLRTMGYNTIELIM